MQKNRQETLNLIAETGVVAVIRAKSKDQLSDIASALLAGGVRNIEVTMTTPDAIAGIEMLSRQFGQQAILGIGTVLDADTARSAIAAGAEFVVSPIFDSAIVAAAHEQDKVCIPGAFTPTEIYAAHTGGADVVKVFPSTSLGPTYFKDILAPLPQLKLTPTGGVDLGNAGAWIKAGAVCIGVGSALVSKDALARSDWPAVTANAWAFIDAVRQARQE
jgi:2-dehydro-3-deoxyphosphogluconate aldolase/(4S)-4-hydroxy-2-oxoglutarate aldolase